MSIEERMNLLGTQVSIVDQSTPFALFLKKSILLHVNYIENSRDIDKIIYN